jgi:predicted NBD/HSP70 family sugar kinase
VPGATATGIDGLRSTLDAVAQAGVEVLGGVPRRAVVAWPGPVSPDGYVWATPTVSSGTCGVDVAAELAGRWVGATVHVLNDLTAAGLRACADGSRDFAVVTVGSGIGHKIFVDGRAVTGVQGRGGELGHLLVDRSADAPSCSCGQRGHLGGIASGRAIVAAVRRSWQQQGDPRSQPAAPGEDPGAAVVRALERGDPAVTSLVRARARILGWGVAALHVAVGVEDILLVGGFALAAGEPFRAAVAEGAAASCWDLGLDWDQAVRLGRPDDDHGLVGAWLTAGDLGWLP